jgi:DNA polymerase elongation subunit (family B)
MSPETFITKDKLPPAVRDIILSCYNDQNEERLLKMNPLIKEEMSKKLKEHNISLGINGACFSQNAQGIIPRTVEQIYNERKRKKKEMFIACNIFACLSYICNSF